MLSILRAAVGSWFAKIFLGLLVASFAVWGVEGVFLNAGTQSVATVGDQSVSTREFARQFRRAVDEYNRQNGAGLTLQQAYEQGLHNQVLTQLVVDALYAEQADRMDLTVSDAKLVREVHSMGAFTDGMGQFDKAQFDFVMRQNGLTEERFLEVMRRDLVRQQLILALTDGATVPDALVETIVAYRGEQRTVEYVTLTEVGIGDLPQPDEDTLKAYHQDHAAQFTSEERRDISLLVLSPARLADDVTVSDEEIAQAYDHQADRLITPEQRTIERVIFSDMDEAKAARARVDGGESLSAVGADMTALTEDDILQIGIERRDLEPAEAEIAFSLAEGEISAPLETGFGPALIRVVKIKAEHVPPLADVRDQLAREIKLEKAADLMFDLIEKTEDSLAGGSTLEETAAAIGVPLTTVGGLNARGFSGGTPAQDLPQHDEFLTTVFEQDTGYDSDLTEAADGSYYIVRVDKITPAALKPFETVKDAVRAAWIGDQKADRLRNAAAQYRGGLTVSGLPQIAEKTGSTVRVSPTLNRFEVPEGWSQAAIDAVFGAEGTDAVVDAPLPNGHLLGVVTSIEKPGKSGSGPMYRQMKQVLDQSFLVDLAAQFQGALEAEYGVDINERALSLAVDQGQ